MTNEIVVEFDEEDVVEEEDVFDVEAERNWGDG